MPPLFPQQRGHAPFLTCSIVLYFKSSLPVGSRRDSLYPTELVDKQRAAVRQFKNR